MNSLSAAMHDVSPLLADLLICPACRSDVTRHDADAAFRCASCSRTFPIYHGIPDFRLSADPYISIEDEYQKSDKIVGEGTYSFDEMIDRYYRLTPEVSAGLQERYKKGLRSGIARGRQFLDAMPYQPEFPMLDIGCGTSGLMVAAGSRGHGPVVGVDIAMRWMISGKQQLIENKQEPLLVCANAEALPFRSDAFASVVSESTLEHATDPRNFLEEASRVGRSRAPFFFQSTNKNSLVEPYTGFPLPSLLPKSLRNRVIERICKTPYLLHPLSKSQISEILKPVAKELRIRAHLPMSEHLSSGSFPKKFLLAVYQKIIRNSLGNRILASVGMFLAISGRFR